MPKPNARLTLRLSAPHNSHATDCIQLVITDVPSGKDIASVDLRGDELVQLLAHRLVGSVEGVPGWLAETRDRSVFGRVRFTTSRHFSGSDHSEDAVRTWARRNAAPLGAHEFQVHRTNAGTYRAVFVFYALVNQDAHVAEVEKIKQDTMDVLPSPSSES